MCCATDTDLENPVVVHLFQGEGEALCQDSVHPALHDGGYAEPVQRELWTDAEIFTLYTYLSAVCFGHLRLFLKCIDYFMTNINQTNQQIIYFNVINVSGSWSKLKEGRQKQINKILQSTYKKKIF